MNLFTLSSVAWAKDPTRMKQLIHLLSQGSHALFLRLDQDALGKQDMPDTCSAECFLTVPLKSLVRCTSSDYPPDESAVELLVSEWSDEQILVVDATAFSADTIAGVLAHLRSLLFTRLIWSPTLAVVLREELLDQGLTQLAATFYCLPSPLSLQEASTYALRLHRTAMWARVLNWSPSTSSRLQALRDRAKHSLKRALRRDDIDRI